jgi:hypothetical protein
MLRQQLDIPVSRPAPLNPVQSQLHIYVNAHVTYPTEVTPLMYLASKEKMLDLTALRYNLEAMGHSRPYELIQTMSKQNKHALLV